MTEAVRTARVGTDAPFDAADPATWIARGRRPEHAAMIAQAWRDFPDLPPSAAPEARMARTRERTEVMRPIHAELARASEADRQARNFAHVERKAASGAISASDIAILDGRDRHGLDWDHAVTYSQGWYAAHAGWPYKGPNADRPGPDHQLAYDLGFADGGGNPDDLFDAARRTFAADTRASNQPVPDAAPLAARPLPSSWTRPTDAATPTRWARRLLILDPSEALGDTAQMLADIRARPGAEALTIVLLDQRGFATDAATGPALDRDRAADLAADPGQGARLRALLAGQEFDDVFIAAEGAALAVLDAHAAALPLCPAMARTCNTPLQQRTHLRLWLDHAAPSEGNAGAGHIRWSKLAQGLSGKLGEFVARYGGKDADGHVILIQLGDGSAATGYVTATGALLDPRVTFTSKRQMRQEMIAALRAFGGATRLQLR